jgi:hypothetical protein
MHQDFQTIRLPDLFKLNYHQKTESTLNYLHKRTLLFTFHELIYDINLDYYFNS